MAIGSISKKFNKLDNNPDTFIYMLSAVADVPEYVANFIYENFP